MIEELVPIQENDYNELLQQIPAVIEHERIKVARHIAATASNTYWEIGKLLHEKELYQLGKEIGVEMVISKLHQLAGELQFAVNHGIMFQAKGNWQSAYASCKRS